MPHAPLDDIRLNHRMDGNADAHVRLLSNGLDTDLGTWDARIPAFAAHFKVLRRERHA